MRRLLLLVGAGVLGAYLLRTHVVEGIYIASGSMEPTYPIGTHLFLNKLGYRFGRPERGDVVVFPSPVDGEKDLVKRVIALGGETVELRKKRVFVNGGELKEPYASHTRGDEALKGDNLGPLTVPEGHIFVMGDNRDFSGDSRDWKDARTGEMKPFIPLEAVKGKVISLTD